LRPGTVDLETQHMLADFGRFVCDHWQRPDHGIWEDRGPARHYTYSKAMCWVALDRLLRLHADGRAPDIDVRALATHRDAIRADVMANGYDRSRGIYTVSYDSSDVDASLLLLGWYGFDDPGSPRMRRTLAAYHERLCVAPGLYQRNLDSLRRGEGAFGICSFWVADLLARGGSTVDEARDVLDAALACANDVGLFGEEIDTLTGSALGNFPQAYTHVGLINAVLSVAAHDRHATAATWRKVAPSREGPCVEVMR
jgi:GH15 family glucan-1,4-alpha-glucosidase